MNWTGILEIGRIKVKATAYKSDREWHGSAVVTAENAKRIIEL